MRGLLRAMFGMLVSGALALGLAGCGGQRMHDSSTEAGYAALVGAGLDLLKAGHASAAAQLFVQAASKDEADPVAHYDLGVVDQREGDSTAALRAYGRALADRPSYVPALYNKAVLLGAHRPLLAIFYYRKVISLRPRAATALLNLGLLLTTVGGKVTRAAGIRALSRAVRLQPSLRGRVPPALRVRLSS